MLITNSTTNTIDITEVTNKMIVLFQKNDFWGILTCNTHNHKNQSKQYIFKPFNNFTKGDSMNNPDTFENVINNYFNTLNSKLYAFHTMEEAMKFWLNNK